MATIVGGNRGRGFEVGQGRAANEWTSKDEKDKSASGKARSRNERRERRRKKKRVQKKERERESVKHPWGVVAGRWAGVRVSRWHLLMAIFCEGRERTNLFSPRDKEERGRVGNRARRKKRSERERGRICPEEKSHQARYTGITPLVHSARGSGEIPGPGPDERIYRGAQDASTHPPTMGRATIYYSRASWHLTCRLAASLFRFSFCRPVDLLVSFSLSFSLSEKRVVSVHVSSWVDRSPRQLRNKVRVRGGANSSPWS